MSDQLIRLKGGDYVSLGLYFVYKGSLIYISDRKLKQALPEYSSPPLLSSTPPVPPSS